MFLSFLLWKKTGFFLFKQRTVGNADKLIDTMNKYGDDLDIVFVWGHNHYEDVMRYEVKQPGDEIMYAADTSRSSFGNPVDPKLKTCGRRKLILCLAPLRRI